MMPTEGYASFPLRTMETNFDAVYVAPMLRLLTAHGATAQELQDETWVNDEGQLEGYKRFLLTFPEGTLYVEGMVLFRSMSFHLRFPDGFRLPSVRCSQQMILAVPAEEVE